MSHPTIRAVISGPRWLALLLVVLVGGALVQSQSPTGPVNGVVRVSGTKNDAPFNGSGFVIALDRGVATIVTASHVLENGLRLQVTFAADPTRSLPLAKILTWEPRNPNGLAVFVVQGDIPGGVQPLRLAESASGLSPGESAFLIGYPQIASGAPRTLTRSFSRRNGSRYEFDGGVGEGISGGPVVAGDKVVGVITETDEQYSYAVPIIILREFLLGSIVSLPPEKKGTKTGQEPPGKTTDIALEYVGDPMSNQSECKPQVLVNVGGTSASPTSFPDTIRNVPLGRQDYRITGQVVCRLYGGRVCEAQGGGKITVNQADTYRLEWVGGIQGVIAGGGQSCQVMLVKP